MDTTLLLVLVILVIRDGGGRDGGGRGGSGGGNTCVLIFRQNTVNDEANVMSFGRLSGYAGKTGIECSKWRKLIKVG